MRLKNGTPFGRINRTATSNPQGVALGYPPLPLQGNSKSVPIRAHPCNPWLIQCRGAIDLSDSKRTPDERRRPSYMVKTPTPANSLITAPLQAEYGYFQRLNIRVYPCSSVVPPLRQQTPTPPASSTACTSSRCRRGTGRCGRLFDRGCGSAHSWCRAATASGRPGRPLAGSPIR